MSGKHVQQMEKPDNHSELRVVLLGRTGAGKSAAGNTILGVDRFPSKFSPKSITREIRTESTYIGERLVTVLDTPGLFDTRHGPELFNQAFPQIQEFAKKAPCIFLIVIGLDRFTDEEFEAIKEIQSRFEEVPPEQFMILFTGGDKLDTTINEFVDEENTLKDVMKHYGQRFHVFNNKNKEDAKQVTHLLKIMDQMIATCQDFHVNRLKEKKTWTRDDHMEILWSELTKLAGSEKQLLQKLGKVIPCPDQGRTKCPKGDQDIGRDQCQVVPQGPMRLVVLGKTGSGKSATANKILDCNTFKSKHGFNSVTKKCSKEEATIFGRNVIVVDTPGFFDTTLPKDELNEEIKKCICLSSPGVHAFLVVLSLKDRLTEDSIKTMKCLHEIFGDEFKKHAMILFSHSDALEGSMDDLIKSNAELEKLLKPFENRIHLFNNTSDDRSQVKELLKKIDRMSKANGECYTDQMYAEAEKAIQEKEIELEGFMPDIIEKASKMIEDIGQASPNGESGKWNQSKERWAWIRKAFRWIAEKWNRFLERHPEIDAALSSFQCFAASVLSCVGAYQIDMNGYISAKVAEAFSYGASNFAATAAARAARAAKAASEGRGGSSKAGQKPEEKKTK